MKYASSDPVGSFGRGSGPARRAGQRADLRPGPARSRAEHGRGLMSARKATAAQAKRADSAGSCDAAFPVAAAEHRATELPFSVLSLQILEILANAGGD